MTSRHGADQTGSGMLTLAPESRGARYDRAIRQALAAAGRDVSVREVRLALKNRSITVNGRAAAPGQPAAGGESVDARAFTARSEAVVVPAGAWAHQIPVLANEEDVLVLDKPAGLPTHPLRPEEERTLLHAAVAIRPNVEAAGPPMEGGLVHRLDTGTSGVVVFAARTQVRDALRADFAAHRVQKRYWALIVTPNWKTHRATGAIGGSGKRVQVLPPNDPDGLPADTELTVHRVVGNRAWVLAETTTGRRHQVRAHLSALGAPLWGDPLYGGPDAPRLGLHASEVVLADGRRFRSPLPSDLTDLLEAP